MANGQSWNPLWNLMFPWAAPGLFSGMYPQAVIQAWRNRPRGKEAISPTQLSEGMDLTEEEYLSALDRLLTLLRQNGTITAQEEANYMLAARRQLVTKGLTRNLPLYSQVAEFYLTPAKRVAKEKAYKAYTPEEQEQARIGERQAEIATANERIWQDWQKLRARNLAEESQRIFAPENIRPWTGEVGRTRSEAEDWASRVSGYRGPFYRGEELYGEEKGKRGTALLQSWGFSPEAAGWAASGLLPGGVGYGGSGQRQWQEVYQPMAMRALQEQNLIEQMYPKEWKAFYKTVPDWDETGGVSNRLQQAFHIENMPEYQQLKQQFKQRKTLQTLEAFGPEMYNWYQRETEGATPFEVWFAQKPEAQFALNWKQKQERLEKERRTRLEEQTPPVEWRAPRRRW